jgi:hypothetical protein
MAAQPIGRYCACGCGASIDDRPVISTRTRECQIKFDHRRRSAVSLVQRSHRRSPHGGTFRARNRLMDGEAPNRRQKPCTVCCGMPWARTGDRFPEARPGHEKPVSYDGQRCRGCGDLYAPEPKPEMCSVIGSSAGLAARHGEEQGVTIERGVNYKTAVKGGK